MKRLILLALCAGTAFAGTASIVASFQGPGAYTYGIDYHASYIYIGDGHNYIYQTTTTGSLVNSLYVGNASWGIDRIDSGFWCCNLGGYIFRLTTSGSILRSFEGPASPSNGITYGGDFLWLSVNRSILYKLTTTGSVVNTFYLPAPRTYTGLCWDAPYLWIASYRWISQITQLGSVVESFPVTGQLWSVSSDGSYLWYSTNNWVYQVKVNFAAVVPASLGRVKALFR